MIDLLDNIQEYSSIGLIIVSIFAIFVSGLFFGISYFIMDVTHDAFLETDCVIDNNLYVESCQDLWELSLYPFLELREILVWFSFFFVFALILGMLIAGYQSGSSPVMLGVLVLFNIVITYGAIEISNLYITMLEIPAFMQIMIPFDVYNQLLIYFPWVIFFVSLSSVILGVVNYQKVVVNKRDERLNF